MTVGTLESEEIRAATNWGSMEQLEIAQSQTYRDNAATRKKNGFPAA